MVLNLIEDFLWDYLDDQVFFIFSFANVLYFTYLFAYVEASLHPWDEAHLVTVCDLSYLLLDSVCHYFTEDFCINVL
jgi:hypothetical protein